MRRRAPPLAAVPPWFTACDLALLRSTVPAEGGAVGDDPGGYAQVVLSALGSAERQCFFGQDLAAIASARGVAPAAAQLRLIETGRGTADYIGHAMIEEIVARAFARPLVLVASDGSSQTIEESSSGACTARPRPASLGIPAVLVNGALSVENGRHTGARAGRVLLARS
jgi:N-acyl-D-aspartate/D-glutamate deacylase